MMHFFQGVLFDQELLDSKIIKCNISLGVVDSTVPGDTENFCRFPALNVPDTRAHALTRFMADTPSWIRDPASQFLYRRQSNQKFTEASYLTPQNTSFALEFALYNI